MRELTGQDLREIGLLKHYRIIRRWVAKKTGLKGCIAHGMLQAGMISSYILSWAKGGILRNFKIRFSDVVNENDILTFNGKIVKKYQENSENLIEVNLVSKNQEDRIPSHSSAIIAFSY